MSLFMHVCYRVNQAPMVQLGLQELPVKLVPLEVKGQRVVQDIL